MDYEQSIFLDEVLIAMAYGIPVLVLKEGTQRTTGRDALRANILAARV